MIKLALLLALAVVIAYFIGNINFARIFAKAFAGKDITQMGSKNPGTMNMLRSRNFGEAFLTMIFEAMKSGIPALLCYFLFEHLSPGFGDIAYFCVAIAVVVGHCFPVFYKYKGGKGVACTFGMFLFHHIFWWVCLIAFAVFFVLFFFIRYAFLVTLSHSVSMSIYATVYYCLHLTWDWWLPIVILIWLNVLLLVFMHRSNIKRFAAGKENEINFWEKLTKKDKPKDVDGSQEKPVEAAPAVEAEPEEEKAVPEHGEE
ncbi:MAG: glycerol-3-phosphate acyltransferase [Clostridia bacterium]|nr:glycerol-3-phosphate acyltransferase [Clostridia bacterium]